MHYTAILALLGVAPLAMSSPLNSRDITKFEKGTTWDIILDKSSVTLEQMKKAVGSVIDVDLFDNIDEGDNIKQLAQKKKVICYFSAGSREDWRDDASTLR